MLLLYSDYTDVKKIDTDLPNFLGTMSKPVDFLISLPCTTFLLSIFNFLKF